MTRKEINRIFAAYVRRFGPLRPSMAWIMHESAMSNFIGFASR